MLSPKRATFSVCASCQPHAARAQVPIRSTTPGSLQCPTTVLRRRPIRVSMNPNSRSPWADWFRFMKSMSISAQGRSRLNCVCRWSSGFCSRPRPAIHIFAGENVCIHAITPTQVSAAFASRQTCRIDSALFDDRPVHDPDRDRRLGVERAGDLARVLVHLPQDVVPVELLAPGQEPDLVARRALSPSPSRRDPDRGRSLLIGFRAWRRGGSGRPAGTSRRSASARGRSAAPGARPTRRSRWPRCTPRSTPGSRSSTPPTSTATGAPSA